MRTVTRCIGNITTLIDSTAGECPTCHFDALVWARTYHVYEGGVKSLHESVFCSRCRVQERRR